ncbi:histone deacetylase [Streptomyces gobitricini]|uniref:Histone deacetylase n=1 Tax=Streptomyces gobitricini TaxID=68211 RepID=A0ABN3MZ51_9ACTN
MTTEVWYTSYGSNTHVDRLAHYIVGGTPPGGARACPGCRDRRLPTASVPVELRGALYFATESPVWTGGRAFYDPDADGRVLARAHRITAEQFCDIAAQEMYRVPGPETDLDLAAVPRDGSRVVLGDGRYETLVRPGTLDGLPLLTFTAPWRMHDVEWTSPSADYLRHLAAGLLAAGAWNADSVATYLASCPGAAGHWTRQRIRDLIAPSP